MSNWHAPRGRAFFIGVIMAKTGKKRKTEERERDLAIISELYLKGIPDWQISEVISEQYEDFDISPRMIRYDKVELRQRWIESQILNFDEAKARELELIDKSIAACWVGWENSLRDEGWVQRDTSISDQLPGGEATSPVKMKSYKKTQRRAARDGSIAWIEQIRKLSDQRAKLLGLYEAEKYQVDFRQRMQESGMDINAIEKTLESALQVVEDHWPENTE